MNSKDDSISPAWLIWAALIIAASSVLAAGPPVVSGVTFGPASSASLAVSGAVVPNGFDTVTWFQYGTNTSYGNISSTNALPGTANALSFDGTTQNGTVPGLGARLPVGEITVEFWQFAAEARPQSTFTLYPDQFTNRFSANVPWSDGNVYWDYGDITTSGRLVYIPPSGQPVTGSWQHFAFVASQSAGQMAIYRNGQLVAQRASAVNTFAPNAADFLLGSGMTASYFFKGQLAEFRIWNIALNQATIQAWMNLSVTSAHPAYNNLAVYWRMNEGAGNVLNDFSSPQNGVLLNNPSWTNGLPLSNSLPVSATLNGLLASTTYHVQLVASNSSGVVAGPDSVFNTLSFSNINAGLPPLWSSTTVWGDFDNDGHLDVLFTGRTNFSGSLGITEIWRNMGDGTFSQLNTGLPGVNGMALANDFDNDGYLDVLLAGTAADGTHLIQLWRNLGNGTFTNFNVGFPPLAGSAVACGDFNNDGLVDILITGFMTNSLTPVTQLWQNLGHGSFTNVNAGFPGSLIASLAVADFDNDGNLDFVLAGATNFSLQTSTVLWRNLGNGTFHALNLGLPTLNLGGSATWIDARDSGFLDLLLNGSPITGPFTQVWRNAGDGTLTNNIDAGLPPLESATVAAGDFNGDGVPDVYMSGFSLGGKDLSQIWTNRGDGTFRLFNELQPGLIAGSAAAADYDEDGRLDVLVDGTPASLQAFTDIYRKLTGPTNTPPSPPSRLNVTQPYPGKLVLSWDAGVDLETATDGLSYNVRIGTTPGGEDILSPLSNPLTGLRRVAQIGNAQKRLFTVMNLPPGTVCYWSVQSVDASYAGSTFAPEQRFIVGGVSVATTGSASELTPTSVRLSGSASPNGFDATAWLLWGTSPELTNSSPAVALGNGTDPVSVSQTLSGLQPGTTYYYQLVATNLYGASLGTLLSFVTPTNAPPTLSDFTNLTIPAGVSSAPIPFVVGDAETPPSSLVVTALALDSNLIPASGVMVTGAGPNRVLTITPAAGQTGSTAVVVLVSDGLAVTAKSFTATVTPNLSSSFTGISRQPGGILLQGTGNFGQGYTVQVSTNLTDWSALTNLSVAPNGAFQFLDSNPTAPARFYRLRSP